MCDVLTWNSYDHHPCVYFSLGANKRFHRFFNALRKCWMFSSIETSTYDLKHWSIRAMIINFDLFVGISAVIPIDLFTKVNSLFSAKKTMPYHTVWMTLFYWTKELLGIALHDPHHLTSLPWECDHDHYDAFFCYICCLIKINYFYGRWWYPWKRSELTFSTGLTIKNHIFHRICKNFSLEARTMPFRCNASTLVNSLTDIWRT